MLNFLNSEYMFYCVKKKKKKYQYRYRYPKRLPKKYRILVSPITTSHCDLTRVNSNLLTNVENSNKTRIYESSNSSYLAVFIYYISVCARVYEFKKHISSRPPQLVCVNEPSTAVTGAVTTARTNEDTGCCPHGPPPPPLTVIAIFQTGNGKLLLSSLATSLDRKQTCMPANIIIMTY